MSEIIKVVAFCGGTWKASWSANAKQWWVYWSSDWEEWPRAVAEGWLIQGPTISGTYDDCDFYLSFKALELAHEEVL